MLDLIRNMALYAAEDGAGALAPAAEAPIADADAAAVVEAPAAEGAASEGDAEPKNKNPWFMKRIAEESAGKQQALERAAAAERRAAAAEALAEQLQRDKNPDQKPPPRTEPRNDNDMEARINARAAQQRLMEDSQEIRNRGIREFGGDFEQSVRMLQAANAVTDDFVADVIGVDKQSAHVILHRLGKDPDKVAALVDMPRVQRIAELVRMNMEKPSDADPKTNTTTPRTTSRAPAPPPAINSSNKTTKDWRNADSDEEFSKGWDSFQKSRRVAR